ncbi:hypothetical protein, partial [Lentibacter sp.]|uniref:hypothetical protein n=1 Tax=Lentibacter sp. TaxID=2024994 RepID=UPI003F69BEFF
MYAQKLGNSPSVKRRLDVLVRPQIEVFKNNRNCTYACDACETKNKSVVHVLVTTGRTYGMSRYLCDECRKKCGLSEV